MPAHPRLDPPLLTDARADELILADLLDQRRLLDLRIRRVEWRVLIGKARGTVPPPADVGR